MCENSSARRARRNISKKLRTMESNRAPRAMFDTLLENCIFYISQLYEFSHRLGQIRPSRSTLARPLSPTADIPPLWLRAALCHKRALAGAMSKWRTPNFGAPARVCSCRPLARLFARSAGRRLLDLLHDATQIITLGRLQRRELLKRVQVL